MIFNNINIILAVKKAIFSSSKIITEIKLMISVVKSIIAAVG